MYLENFITLTLKQEDFSNFWKKYKFDIASSFLFHEKYNLFSIRYLKIYNRCAGINILKAKMKINNSNSMTEDN